MKKLLMILLAVMVFCTYALAEATEYIEAEGVVYFEAGMNPNQMRRMSIMDAYRYLAEQVDTLYVKADTTIKDMREMDDIINTKVEAALRGAKVISVNRESDGSFMASRNRFPVLFCQIIFALKKFLSRDL